MWAAAWSQFLGLIDPIARLHLPTSVTFMRFMLTKAVQLMGATTIGHDGYLQQGCVVNETVAEMDRSCLQEEIRAQIGMIHELCIGHFTVGAGPMDTFRTVTEAALAEGAESWLPEYVAWLMEMPLLCHPCRMSAGVRCGTSCPSAFLPVVEFRPLAKITSQGGSLQKTLAAASANKISADAEERCGYRSAHLYFGAAKKEHILQFGSVSADLEVLIKDVARSIERGQGLAKLKDSFNLRDLASIDFTLEDDQFRINYIQHGYLELTQPAWEHADDGPLFLQGYDHMTKAHTVESIRTVLRKAGIQTQCQGAEGMVERSHGHCLRISGSQALVRMGFSTTLIMLLGRWGSHAIFRYIQDSPPQELIDADAESEAREAPAGSLEPGQADPVSLDPSGEGSLNWGAGTHLGRGCSLGEGTDQVLLKKSHEALEGVTQNTLSTAAPTAGSVPTSSKQPPKELPPEVFRFTHQSNSVSYSHPAAGNPNPLAQHSKAKHNKVTLDLSTRSGVVSVMEDAPGSPKSTESCLLWMPCKPSNGRSSSYGWDRKQMSDHGSHGDAVREESPQSSGQQLARGSGQPSDVAPPDLDPASNSTMVPHPRPPMAFSALEALSQWWHPHPQLWPSDPTSLPSHSLEENQEHVGPAAAADLAQETFCLEPHMQQTLQPGPMGKRRFEEEKTGEGEGRPADLDVGRKKHQFTPCIHYVDDLAAVEDTNLSTSSFSAAHHLWESLGFRFNPSKKQSPADTHKIQGVIMTIAQDHFILAQDDVRVQVITQLKEIRLQNNVHPDEA
eukprot:s87_g31.t1